MENNKVKNIAGDNENNIEADKEFKIADEIKNNKEDQIEN